MLLDYGNMWSLPAGDSPTVIGNTDSTNIIDLGTTRDIGAAVTINNLFPLVQVVTAFVGATATLQVRVMYAPDSSGVPGTFVIGYQSDAVAVASLIQGYRFIAGALLLSPGTALNPTAYRFLKLTYVIATAAMTAGQIKAGFVPSLDAQPTYQRNYTA